MMEPLLLVYLLGAYRCCMHFGQCCWSGAQVLKVHASHWIDCQECVIDSVLACLLGVPVQELDGPKASVGR